MMAREVSYRTFPMIGVPDPFHATSHHQNDPDKLEKLTKINTYHVGLVAYFLEKLRATPDGDGNLLDHSLILYGSCMSNSNLHNHNPLPIFVAGGADGQMKGGRHIKYPNDTPTANLLLTILDKAGIHRRQHWRQRRPALGSLRNSEHAQNSIESLGDSGGVVRCESSLRPIRGWLMR